MGWLSQLSGGALVGIGSTVTVVLAAITYVVKFQSTFTDRLEKQGEKDEQKIQDLGNKLDEERGKRRRAEDRAAKLMFICRSRGLDVPDELLREEPQDG